jgi:hypothetical protein
VSKDYVRFLTRYRAGRGWSAKVGIINSINIKRSASNPKTDMMIIDIMKSHLFELFTDNSWKMSVIIMIAMHHKRLWAYRAQAFQLPQAL